LGRAADLSSARVIRPATSSDAPSIAELHRASILGLCAREYTSEQLAAWIAALPERYEPLVESATVMVMEDDGVVVGFGVCSPQQGLINATYVSPGATGRSIGRRLMTAMEAAIGARGAREIRLNATLNAVGFYESLGYTSEGESVNRLPTGIELPCVAMSKSVA
jgi:putative acetyltransferase